MRRSTLRHELAHARQRSERGTCSSPLGYALGPTHGNRGARGRKSPPALEPWEWAPAPRQESAA